MRKGIYTAMVLLMMLPLVASACAGSPVKPLSDNEKAELVQAALRTSEASEEYIRNNGIYKSEFMWTKILPSFSRFENRITIETLPLTDEELLENKEKPGTNKPLAIYPTILFKFGQSEDKQVRVVLDRETKKTLFVERLVKYKTEAHIPSPDNALVIMESESYMSGFRKYMFIYQDGSVVYIEETGWRGLFMVNEKPSIKKTGKISYTELLNLKELFNAVPFQDNPQTKLSPDVFINIPLETTVNSPASSNMVGGGTVSMIDYYDQGISKRITVNYFPLISEFNLPSDIPDSVKQICTQLKCIADKTVASEYRLVINWLP